MSTKTKTKNVVEFLATSPRLAHAYRYAAKHNKRLAHCAEMHLIGAVTAVHEASYASVLDAIKRSGDVVVLSHADEDLIVPENAKFEQALAGAFYLLFTEPTTHPEQILQWIRRAKVRSQNRLHVVKVEKLETPNVSNLLGRMCFAMSGDQKRGGIIDAYSVGDSLVVRGPRHRLLQVPFKSMPSLRDKSRKVQGNFEIDPDGSFLFWPDLDVHLGWNQFLQAVDPNEVRKAQQRIEGFNQRYGAAIKKIREQAEISQSKIPGLTDRQVRRIEQGESRATASALAAFAKAHNLETNAYLEKLTNAMK